MILTYASRYEMNGCGDLHIVHRITLKLHSCKQFSGALILAPVFDRPYFCRMKVNIRDLIPSTVNHTLLYSKNYCAIPILEMEVIIDENEKIKWI